MNSTTLSEFAQSLPTLEQIAAERQRREANRRLDEETATAGANLPAFIRAAWHVIEPGQPYIHGWHVDVIAEHLQAVTHGDIIRLLINVPPGSMKSLMVGVFWPAFEWGPGRLPHYRYLGTAHNERLAIRDNLRMRRLVESEWYQRRWPIQLTTDQNAKLKFENRDSGFREAMPFTSLTGSRGDRVLIDDPLSVDDAFSDLKRENANQTFLESVPTRLNDPKRSAIVVIMQRLHERDVAGMILEKDFGYEHLMLPMEFEPARKCYTSIGFEDPRKEAGELLFPERFSREVVERDKLQMTPYAVAGQFQQSPVPRNDSGYFQGNWIKEIAKVPSREAMRVYGASDYAVTDGGGDYTVHIVVGLDSDGRMYVLDLWRAQASSDIWVETLCDLILKHKPMDWAEEGGQIKAGVGPFLTRRMRERKAYVHRRQFPTKGDKAVRAQSIRGRMALEGLYVPQGAPWKADLVHELLVFPAGANDDVVDALGLIGQMLDEIQAAPRAKPKTNGHDRWDRAFARQDGEGQSWKTL